MNRFAHRLVPALLAAVLVAGAPASSQAPAGTRPAATATADVAALDAYFAAALADWPIPGFSVAIQTDGDLMYAPGVQRWRGWSTKGG